MKWKWTECFASDQLLTVGCIMSDGGENDACGCVLDMNFDCVMFDEGENACLWLVSLIMSVFSSIPHNTLRLFARLWGLSAV